MFLDLNGPDQYHGLKQFLKCLPTILRITESVQIELSAYRQKISGRRLQAELVRVVLFRALVVHKLRLVAPHQRDQTYRRPDEGILFGFC